MSEEQDSRDLILVNCLATLLNLDVNMRIYEINKKNEERNTETVELLKGILLELRKLNGGK